MTTRIATPEEIARTDAYVDQWWAHWLTLGLVPKPPEPEPEREMEAG